VDRGKIFEQLEKILTTAKIKDLQATEVESAGSTRATGSPIADSKTSEPNPSAAESNTANVKAAETTEKAQAVTPGQK